jgi:AraC family transcriptional regulator
VNIDIVERAPARVACLRYTGPFGAPLGRFWRKTVLPWLADYDVVDCPRYGVSIDDPTNTPPEQCRYDACVELPAGLSLPDVAPVTLAGGTYAVTRFNGGGHEIGSAWTSFINDAIARGFVRDARRPLVERYPRGVMYDPHTGAFGCGLCVPLVSPAARVRSGGENPGIRTS